MFTFCVKKNLKDVSINYNIGLPCSSQMTLTNGGSVGSLGESDTSSTMSFDTSTVRESPESEKDGNAQGIPRESTDTEKPEKEKIKTHSRWIFSSLSFSHIHSHCISA